MKTYTRVENALWGLFISDSLSMPVHWYYKRQYIKQDFGQITTYEDARHPHPESFMVGMDYFPDVLTAQKMGRRFDILHKHKDFYKTSYSHLDIATEVHSGEHANAMPKLEERYHYHYGLKAGENTLGAHLVRVLMRSIIKNKGYNQESFLEDFVEYLTSDGENKDPYLEIYIRDWFVNYASGIAPELCAKSQRDRWSIGSHGGIIRPLVLALTSNNAYDATGVAISHQQLTHASQNVSSSLSVLVPLLFSLINGEDSMSMLNEYAKKISLIKIHGWELSKKYAEAKGPGNIPKDEMWKIHTEYSQNTLDEVLKDANDENMITTRFATACYPEHGVPLLMYFLKKHKFDFKATLLENANAGGDNVHRGMILGLLAGASATSIDEHLKSSLVEYEGLNAEIKAFVKEC